MVSSSGSVGTNLWLKVILSSAAPSASLVFSVAISIHRLRGAIFKVSTIDSAIEMPA